MSVVALFRDNSEYTRVVTDFIRDMQVQTGHEVETVDPDSPRGSSLTQAYDIVEYPTLLALSEDGQVLSMWRGLPLPTISEVSYYA